MSSIICPECNLANWETAVACKRCGYFFQQINAGIADNTPSGFFSNEKKFGVVNQPNVLRAGYHPPKQKIGMAITSLVMGLVGCFLTSPVGLILGIVSLVKANRYPKEYGGKGLAIAGIALNSLGLLFLPLIAAIAIPNLLAARRSANEASAIATVRTISAAEQVYMTSIGKRCADLKVLASLNLVDTTIASGEKNGYRFLVISLPTLRGDCEIHATPVSPSHGTRSFYSSTEDGVVRAAAKNGSRADMNDPPINGLSSSENTQPSRISTR